MIFLSFCTSQLSSFLLVYEIFVIITKYFPAPIRNREIDESVKKIFV